MRTYQLSLKTVSAARFEDYTMATLKFVGVFCLVYFTIYVNAGKRNRVWKTVLEKLNKLKCPKQGTLRNVFYLVNVSNGFKSVVFRHS